MATIKPFKAVRATRDKVALVSSRSYDAYSHAELGAQLNFNPFSFLHIISPSYAIGEKISMDERFTNIHNKYREFKEKHTYIKDDKPVYYIYQKITPKEQFIGIIAASSTEDYKNNIIKKHEKTLKKREILFKNYLKATGFNAEPVLLTYPDNKRINKIIHKYKHQRAEYEFTTENNKTHLLWIVDNDQDINTISREFKKTEALYIADGHHRSASSYLLAEELKDKNPNHTGREPYNFCLSYLISESNLKIAEFNRLVKNIQNFDKSEFLLKVSKYFTLTKLQQNTYKPLKSHSFSIYIGNELYKADFKHPKKGYKTCLHELDTHILSKYILKKILNIKNIRTDKRIDYIAYHKGQEYLKTKVQNGEYQIGFGLFSITVNQLKQIADNNYTMPPKSTYILPKLRSGLTIYEF